MCWLTLITTLNTPCRNQRRCSHVPLSNCYAPKSPGFYGRINRNPNISSTTPALSPSLFLSFLHPLAPRRPHYCKKIKTFGLLPVFFIFVFCLLIFMCLILQKPSLDVWYLQYIFVYVCMYVYMCLGVCVCVCVCVCVNKKWCASLWRIGTHTDTHIFLFWKDYFHAPNVHKGF